MQTGCNRAADRRRCRSADRARRLAAALLLLSAAVACGREEPPAGPLQARNLLNGPFETAPETPSDAQNPEAHADAPLALRTGEPTRFADIRQPPSRRTGFDIPLACAAQSWAGLMPRGRTFRAGAGTPDDR